MWSADSLVLPLHAARRARGGLREWSPTGRYADQTQLKQPDRQSAGPHRLPYAKLVAFSLSLSLILYLRPPVRPSSNEHIHAIRPSAIRPTSYTIETTRRRDQAAAAAVVFADNRMSVDFHHYIDKIFLAEISGRVGT